MFFAVYTHYHGAVVLDVAGELGGGVMGIVKTIGGEVVVR